MAKAEELPCRETSAMKNHEVVADCEVVGEIATEIEQGITVWLKT